MRITEGLATAASVSCLLLLAACGGGGDGSTPNTQLDRQPSPSMLSLSDARTAGQSESRSAAAAAAGNLPSFGSVTQSSNAGTVAGTTGDSATTSFDGRNVRVTVRRADGSRLSLDPASARVAAKEDYEPIVPGYTYQGTGLLDYTDTSVSIAAIYVNWNDRDRSDYLAGGYWMHFVGSVDPLRVDGAEIGAFVDGPELSGAPNLPVRGTASYRGEAGGFYGYASTAGTEIGEFAADAEFSADFSSNTISGCLGCNGGATVSGVAVSSAGQAVEFADEIVPVRLRLGQAAFGSGGTFRNRDVTLERDDATVTSTTGSWGGRFSNIPDSAGDPRLAAGTAGAEWTEADGSQGAMVGAWYGIKN
ncbi:MAG: hypothetical protein OYH76_24940 [Defluviicoccus sp.]|nr:hypothetical protein [Defluviicoccus sp.]MDE0279155.1 hypothetical protein [Defluviicoccus sp.]